MIKYFESFAGIGGFRLGIGSQHNCIGYSEIDKYAIQIYEKHFKGCKNYGDITTINTKVIPDFDLFVGGFPCQSFSIAGQRRGFEDTRGTLFFEIARILKDKRPQYFVLENVKGLLSHDQGDTFKTVIKVLDELGYFIEWQVLNSKNFGVPQNRERVYIIGHLRGECIGRVFPISRKGGQINANNIIRLNRTKHCGDIVHSINGISPTLDCTHDQHFIAQSVASDSAGVAVDQHIRKLTPIECERLQGFPDDWTKCVSNNQRYKCLGNAVTVNVVEYIMRMLMGAYNEQI